MAFNALLGRSETPMSCASPEASRFAYSDEFLHPPESPATKKTKRKTSLAASIGKKLLGTSKSKVEEVDDAEKSEGEGAREALAGARRPKAKKGELTMTVRQLTALQSQLQSLRRELATVKAAAGGLPAEGLRMLQPLLEQHAGMRKEYVALHNRFDLESTQRRQLYNRLMEFQGNIRVFCRCRPMLDRETGAGTAVEFNALNHMEFTHTVDTKRSTFVFDRVYQPAASQAEVFQDCAPVVTSILDGYNVCILAYGQTGTGKTHTMWGREAPHAQRGINFRTLEALFVDAKSRAKETQYSFYVSMLEVYNDQLRDLIHEPAPPARRGDPVVRPKLEVRQSRDEEGFEVHGLEEVGPLSGGMDEVMHIFRNGNANRATAATAMNTDSSRSHSLLRVRVRSRNTLTGEQRAAKLWLVDLAGSERLSRSEATGERMKEAQHINKSLSALGDCVQALCARQEHVPYRNAKLTQVLQDSLGGEAKTLMYVQVSPSSPDAAETLCTLNFANRARATDLGTKGTKDTSASLSKMKQDVLSARASNREAQSEAAKLRSELGDARRQLADRAEGVATDHERELGQLRRQAAAAAATVAAQMEQIAALQAAQEAAWSEAALATAKTHAAEAAAAAAAGAGARAMEQTPTVKAAYTTPLTTPFAVAETPMCLMMAATTVHSPCGVSPIALGLASPELSTSPAAVPRAPLATLNGVATDNAGCKSARGLVRPRAQQGATATHAPRGILRQSLPTGLNKTRLASLQPVPAAATSSARAGLRSQSQKILLNEVNPFQSRRSLPAAAAATLTPSKRKDEHPQSPDGKRPKSDLQRDSLGSLKASLPKRPSTAVGRFASAAKGSMNKARKSISGSLIGTKPERSRRSSMGGGWSHSYK